MQKVKITKIFTKQETSRSTGKPYTRYGFKCNEYGDVWVSGFGSKENANWKEGDVVEVIIEKKPNPKGGEFINFSLPKAANIAAEGLNEVLNKLTKMNLTLEIIKEAVAPAKPPRRQTTEDRNENYPEEYGIPDEDKDINPEDIPF